jgi:ankyrin repeat protein
MKVLSPAECHELAWSEQWERVPFNDLTREHIRYKTILHGTILHAGAVVGRLRDIPPEFHTHENYLQRDNKGRTVFEAALESGKILDLPRDLLNCESYKLVCKAIDSRQLIAHILDGIASVDFPKDILTPESLMIEQHDEMYHIHALGRRGWLRHLPKEIFTSELVFLEDGNKSNLLHYAARYEGINAIPPQYLTRKNLTKANKSGKTPLHWAVANAKLKGRIPEGILAPEDLWIKDKQGDTVLHTAVHSGSITELPESLITEEGLKIPDNSGRSSLDSQLKSYFNVTHPEGLRIILKKLSDKTLNEIGIEIKDKGVLKEIAKEIGKRNVFRLKSGRESHNTLEI